MEAGLARRQRRRVSTATASGLSGRSRRNAGLKSMSAHTERSPEMATIVVSENSTLDGIVQDPAGAEGFARGGWVGRIGEQGL